MSEWWICLVGGFWFCMPALGFACHAAVDSSTIMHVWCVLSSSEQTTTGSKFYQLPFNRREKLNKWRRESMVNNLATPLIVARVMFEPNCLWTSKRECTHIEWPFTYTQGLRSKQEGSFSKTKINYPSFFPSGHRRGNQIKTASVLIVSLISHCLHCNPVSLEKHSAPFPAGMHRGCFLNLFTLTFSSAPSPLQLNCSYRRRLYAFSAPRMAESVI